MLAVYINKEKACTISKKIKKEKQLMIISIIIEMNNKCGKRKKKHITYAHTL